MSSQMDKIVDSRVDIWKSLRLHARFETTHTTFSNSSRLMGKLSAIIRILRGIMKRFRDQFPVSDAIASQLIRHNPPRLILVALEHTLEETPCGLAISTCL